MTLRLIFMGTPDFAVPALTELAGRGHEIAAVYTQPPRPAGRGMAERQSAVHRQAELFGIPVVAPTSLRGNDPQAQFAGFGADAAVVVAYGLILPEAVLGAPRLGCYNIHASLLPRWRGAAPIQRAIMAGDRETGVAVMKMDAGLDTGPVCLAERTAIAPDESAGSLHDRLASLGADLIVRAIAALEHDGLSCKAQPETGVTYADKISKSETRIDWNRSATDIHNQIRGLSPAPGAWCLLPATDTNRRVKVLRAVPMNGSGTPGTVIGDQLIIACGRGAIALEQLQPAGKAPMDSASFLRGNPVAVGSALPGLSET